MKTVLKGRAWPRLKKEVKMKMFKPGVKLVMFSFFILLLFYVMLCRVMFRHVSMNCP